jgi:deazaflavin-dependent oxidoreductase (nitroreductase family)
MTDPAPDAANGFNDKIIQEFRANHGRVTGPMSGTPILLLHHVGARSGIERVTPLAYTPHGDDGYLIVASNGGSPTHPSWYYNLKAHPETLVEMDTETFTARAEELKGTARANVWPKLLAESPSLREFDATTTRQVPLFLLTRADSRVV